VTLAITPAAANNDARITHPQPPVVLREASPTGPQRRRAPIIARARIRRLDADPHDLALI
jgi:hypothetical protein